MNDFVVYLKNRITLITVITIIAVVAAIAAVGALRLFNSGYNPGVYFTDSSAKKSSESFAELQSQQVEQHRQSNNSTADAASRAGGVDQAEMPAAATAPPTRENYLEDSDRKKLLSEIDAQLGDLNELEKKTKNVMEAGRTDESGGTPEPAAASKKERGSALTSQPSTPPERSASQNLVPKPSAPDQNAASSQQSGRDIEQTADAPTNAAGGASGDEAVPTAALEFTEASGKVARAQFTDAVEQSEPINDLGSVVHWNGEKVQRLYYFTDLRGLNGEKVTHRWEHNGEIMAEISFSVGGERWRAYSSKQLTPTMAGRWQVLVLNSGGNTLQTSNFLFSTQKQPVSEIQ